MVKIQQLIKVFRTSFSYSIRDWKNFSNYISPIGKELLFMSLDNDIDDNEAAKGLLRTDVKDQNYRRIKTRLTSKLFEEVLRFSPSARKFSLYQRTYYSDQKLFAIFKILRGLGQRDLCVYLASKLHRRSKLHHFTDIRLETSKYLLSYYCTNKPNNRLALEYSKELECSIEIMSIENELERQYYNALGYLISKEGHPEALDGILENIALFEKNLGLDSSRFHLVYYQFKGIIHQEKKEFKNALKSLRIGLQYCETLPYEHLWAKKNFLRLISICYLELGYKLEAKQALEKALYLNDDESQNWFNLKLNLMVLELQAGEYNKANEIFKEIRNHKIRKSIPNTTNRYFNCCELLFLYLKLTKRIQPDAAYSLRKALSTIKDLTTNDTEQHLYTRIVELLINLHFRNHARFGSIIGAVNTSQVLNKKNPDFRSLCFIKMLLQFPKRQYHPEAVKRHTQQLFKKLEEASQVETTSEKEIIPLESLWEIVISDLESSYAEIYS